MTLRRRVREVYSLVASSLLSTDQIGPQITARPFSSPRAHATESRMVGSSLRIAFSARAGHVALAVLIGAKE
jgi:predicted ATPase with chaperone activity